MVEHQLPKLTVRVRFSSPAPLLLAPVYDAHGDTGVSWFGADPVTSLDLISALAPPQHGAIIDVGGGAEL